MNILLELKERVNKEIQKAYTKNWDDFLIVAFFFLAAGVIMFYFYPILNLWIAMLNIGLFCLVIFMVFTRG